MYSSLLDEADVKVVYDSQGNKHKVLLSYEKYRAIMEFVERYAYFYSLEVQERKSNEDLLVGTLRWMSQTLTRPWSG